MSKIFSLDEEFKQSTKRYNYMDGLMALLLFLIMCGMYALLAVLDKNYLPSGYKSQLVGCGFNLLLVGISILLVKMRKQSISTIGLTGGKWKISLIAGSILAFIFFFNNCLSHVIGGAVFVEGKKIVLYIIYFFCVALCEEVVFRGYIGTRLYGLLKSSLAVVIITGVLFILMHFPYRMIAYGMTLEELTVQSGGWILDLFVTHVLLSLIYMKTDSLYGSILPHWVSNLAYNIILR